MKTGEAMDLAVGVRKAAEETWKLAADLLAGIEVKKAIEAQNKSVEYAVEKKTENPEKEAVVVKNVSEKIEEKNEAFENKTEINNGKFVQRTCSI